MQITLTPEQQAALCRGEPITITPPKPKWPFNPPVNSNYRLVTVGCRTTISQDHKENNVFQFEKTASEVERKLHFIMMCARFREHFEPDWEESPYPNGENWNYFVYFSRCSNMYWFDSVFSTDYKSVVYMSRECAKALAELLNNNQVPGFEL